MVAEYKAGSSVLLRRNPNYWKKDSQGRRLPYLSIPSGSTFSRIADVEMLRFKRGELDLINTIDSDYFDRAGREFAPSRARCRTYTRFRLYVFNQVASAPIPSTSAPGIRDTNFRRAISQAINRDDLSRVVSMAMLSPPSAGSTRQ